MKLSRKFWLLPLIGLVPLMVLGALNPGNRAATSPQHPDARLRTRYYAASPDEILQTVQNIVPQLRTYGRNWRIVSTQRDGEKIIVHCEVPVLMFTDDLHIEINAENTHTRVDIRSKSRVGRSDFGENRRHVLQCLRKFPPAYSSDDLTGPKAN